LLGGKKGIRPVKTEWWGADVVICLERGADLHMAQLMSLPLTASCFSKIQIGFTFLVLAHLGSPGKRADKRVCVCVCVVCISATTETISAKKAETIEIPFGGRTRHYGLKEPRIIWECTFAPPGEYDGSINVAAAMRPNVPIL